MTSEVKKNRPLGDHTKLQLAEDYRYPTSAGRMDKFNKGIATAITALKQSCDNQGVFTWGEATYFILPPIVKKFPTSFQQKYDYNRNVYSVLSRLAQLGLVYTVDDDTPHTDMTWASGIKARLYSSKLVPTAKDSIPRWIIERAFHENRHELDQFLDTLTEKQWVDHIVGWRETCNSY